MASAAPGPAPTLGVVNDLDLARTAAATAAEIVAAWAGRLESADFKSEGNPVTQADRDAEQAILDLLDEHRPDDGVVGEEGASREGSTARRWLIDPLDGTVNFLHGFPQVAVSVALHDEHGPLVGVVRDVFRVEEFWAHRGHGAFRDEDPVRVSGRTELTKALVATGFSYDRQERGREYGRVLGSVLQNVRGVRRLGSAALDLAWVACGRLDGYWEARLGPWDVAAGFLLVTEAGGVVTGYDGGAPSEADCVAANPTLQPLLLQVVVDAIEA